MSAVTLLLVAVAVISTVSAVRLDTALTKTEAAERKARLREAEALVGQARRLRDGNGEVRLAIPARQFLLSVQCGWLLTEDSAGGQARAVSTWKPGPRLGPGVPCDVSADGRLAALVQADGIYRLVEMAAGRELARLSPATGGLTG